MKFSHFTRAKTAPLKVTEELREAGNGLKCLLHPKKGGRLDIFELADDLHRLEKRASLNRERISGLNSPFTQRVSNLVHRFRERRCSPGRKSLFNIEFPRLKPEKRDELATIFYAIDAYLAYTRSQEDYRSIIKRTSADVVKRFRYVRPVTRGGSSVMGTTIHRHETGEDSPREEWRFDGHFHAGPRQLNIGVDSNDVRTAFKKILFQLRGLPVSPHYDLSIVLPTPRICTLEDKEDENDNDITDDDDGENKHVDKKENIEEANQSYTRGMPPADDVNQNQGVPDGFRSSLSMLKKDSKASKVPSLEMDFGCKLTIFGAYIVLRWVRHVVALAKKKGFHLSTEANFGEISVTTRCASLFALLDITTVNVVTCPKLKLALAAAVDKERRMKQLDVGFGPGGNLQRPTIPNTTASAPLNSPLFFFARNRIRHRRTALPSWITGSHGSILGGGDESSMALSVKAQRQFLRSGSAQSSRSGVLSHMRSLGRRRSSSIHLDRRRTSVNSISILDVVDSADEKSRSKGSVISSGIPQTSQSTLSSMEAMVERLRLRNTPGFLALQPLQRLAEKIKHGLAVLTTSMMRGCKYAAIKKTKLGPTLAFVLRDHIRDLLNDYHDCQDTSCQEKSTTMRDPELVAAQLDTATFRVVAHVTVIELVGQNAMTASQALHEDHMDTFYAFTYRAFDAITVSTVYLIRQFVRFPNLIIASSPLVKEAYEKSRGPSLLRVSSMEAMAERLRLRNTTGFLAMQPLQRLAEKIKHGLAVLTTSMMRGCKYAAIKKVDTRTPPPLSSRLGIPEFGFQTTLEIS